VTSKEPVPLYRKKLGCAVRAQRDALGLSQERLAELADCHRNYIGLVERGEQNVTVGNLVRIARALKCKVSGLLARAGL
jgi:transcriptional regulator with XRE-family HTH domain